MNKVNECILCKKEFADNFCYKRHSKGVKACISNEKVIEIINEKNMLKNHIGKLIDFIQSELPKEKYTKEIESIIESKILNVNGPSSSLDTIGNINGNSNSNVNANKTTQRDHNVIGNNSGNNSGNTVNIVINNYNSPNFDGIEDKFLSNLLTTWDQLIYEKFKLIYVNEDKPENQSIYAPSRDRNRVKIKSDGEIKVSSLNDVLENIEDMIVEKCEHAIVDSNKTKEEKDLLFYMMDNKYLDIQRSRDYYKEISNDAYLELKRTRNRMIQKIRKHLYDKKESLEIRKQELLSK